MNFDAFKRRPDQYGEYSILVRRIDEGSLSGKTTPPIRRKSLSDDSHAGTQEQKLVVEAEETDRIERQGTIEFHPAPKPESVPVKDNRIKPEVTDVSPGQKRDVKRSKCNCDDQFRSCWDFSCCGDSNRYLCECVFKFVLLAIVMTLFGWGLWALL